MIYIYIRWRRKEDRGCPFGLGSALGLGAGPSFLGRDWPFHSSVRVGPFFLGLGLALPPSFSDCGLALPLRGGGWPFLLGVSVGPSFSGLGLALTSRGWVWVLPSRGWGWPFLLGVGVGLRVGVGPSFSWVGGETARTGGEKERKR